MVILLHFLLLLSCVLVLPRLYGCNSRTFSHITFFPDVRNDMEYRLVKATGLHLLHCDRMCLSLCYAWQNFNVVSISGCLFAQLPTRWSS
jgi:hypothetical protein